MDFEKKLKEALSLYLCRYKNVQDFFVAKKSEINLDGFDCESREFHDIDNEEDFNKICGQFNFTVPDADIKKRFREKAHFCVITEAEHFGCWGWYISEPEDFYVLEIDRTSKIPENAAVLFHYYSNPDYRRKGFYFDLLRNVALKNGKDYSIIYAYGTNPASSDAIKKAGYKFVGRMGHKDFLSFDEMIKKSEV